MNTTFVLTNEDCEVLGVCQDSDTAKNLARDICQDMEMEIVKFVPSLYDESFEVEFKYQDSDSDWDGVFYVNEVRFYTKGTLFPVDVGGDRPIEIPAFLQRQAE